MPLGPFTPHDPETPAEHCRHALACLDGAERRARALLIPPDHELLECILVARDRLWRAVLQLEGRPGDRGEAARE